MIRGRTRLSARDAAELALLGVRSRPTRAVLSALGVALGIAALVAITGATDSRQAQLRADLDEQGANLLTVSPAQDPQGEPIPLPTTAPAMLSRIGPVERIAAVHNLAGTSAYRSDLIPSGQSGGLVASYTEDDLPAVLEIDLVWGRWFEPARTDLPTVVLGSVAADRLGIGPENAAAARVLVGGQWYGVIGILAPAGLASSVDSSVFVAAGWITGQLIEAAPISTVYLRAASGTTSQVEQVLGATANPTHPDGVRVRALADLAGAQASTDEALSSLVLALSGISLLVGGVGIANTMVVAVLERRGEIGLRRALGARTGQVTWQFLLEAAVLALLGGLTGTVVGALAVLGLTTWQGSVTVLRPEVLAGGPGIAIAVGVLAGVYPAARAARQPPTAALRST